MTLGHVRQGPVEIGGLSRLNELKLRPQRRCRDLCFLQLVLLHASSAVPGCQRTATRLTPGTACLSSSRRLPTSSEERLDTPVTLPLGRARLATSPLPTGSATKAKTMGRVPVACLAARVATMVGATMTSTLSATRSAARAGAARAFPPHLGIQSRDCDPRHIRGRATLAGRPFACGDQPPGWFPGSYSNDLGRLLGLGRERRRHEAEGESDCECRASDHHAATASWGLGPAVIFRLPSILRNLIPLPGRPAGRDVVNRKNAPFSLRRACGADVPTG
jgi:hypothetical protein